MTTEETPNGAKYDSMSEKPIDTVDTRDVTVEKDVTSVEKRKGGVFDAIDAVIGEGYNQNEVRYVLLAAVLIAVNNGFVNGITMSGLLIANEEFNDALNPKTAMVSGVSGIFTSSTVDLIKQSWDQYRFHVFLMLSYAGGAFITAILSPKAKPYAVDPFFGPSLLIAATMLLLASILALYESPSRFVFYLAMCANGICNGVASIYSANLIRCTLTGAMTDIAIVIGQMLRGNNDKFGRGAILAIIVISFWVGGLLSFSAVRKFKTMTLFVNAVLLYLIGFLNVFYLVHSLNLSFFHAISGSWTWVDVLKKIEPPGGQTKECMMALFHDLDHDKGGTLDMSELRKGLKGAVTDEELKTLLQAADSDGDGEISLDEWAELINELFDKE